VCDRYMYDLVLKVLVGKLVAVGGKRRQERAWFAFLA